MRNLWGFRDMHHVKFKHFIITRFGLGQRKDDFFRLNIEYLERLLSVSLKNQTCKSFSWLVMIDVRAPGWVFERLEYLLNDVPGANYIVHDPFQSLSVAPDIPSVLEKQGVSRGEYIVTTRVDSDDALSVNFVELVNKCLAGYLYANGRVPVSVNPVNGVYYFPLQERLFSVYKGDYSVQTIGSIFNPEFIHAHSGSHKQLPAYLRGLGFQAIVFAPEEPMWLRSMRKDSNVHQKEGVPTIDWKFYIKVRLRQWTSIFFRQSTRTLIKKRINSCDALHHFAFSKECQDRASFVERTMTIKDDSASGEEWLKRWQYKQSILNEYIRVLQSESIDEEEYKRCRSQLICRYYAR